MPTKLRPLGDAWRPLFESALVALRESGVDPSAAWIDDAARRVALGRLATFLDLVVTWNARLDLTAARHADELVDLYLADALVLAAHADRTTSHGASWVDVGSGGGAPGLVLGLLRPDLELTLVEPRQKRVAFLRTAVGSLSLPALKVVAGRSDSIPDQSAEVAISRATFSPDDWLVEGARLARASVWVLLARAEAPALGGWMLRQQIDYAWPASGARRSALEFVPSPK